MDGACKESSYQLLRIEHIDCSSSHQRRAADQRFFIEVEFRMVVSIIEMAFLVRRANKEKTAVHFFKQERRVFGAHRYMGSRTQVGIGQDAPCCLLHFFADGLRH